MSSVVVEINAEPGLVGEEHRIPILIGPGNMVFAPNFTMLPVRRTKRNAHGWSTGVHLGLVQSVSYSLVGNPNSRVVLQPDLHPVGSDAGFFSGH